ncbi:MAG: hypothetical protein A4E53_02362 [Pelotomaculum sp. PtaB.Bin104]|nr:MAG: hypothetical protein A4E53_02362 [Pelotomaculum sp. PtaB.Bin104]
MIESILKNCAIDKVLNNTAGGTGDTLNGDILDLQNYNSVCFILTTGNVVDTAVGTLKAYCGNEAALGDGAYKTTTASFTANATNSDNKAVVLDVVRPGKRYVRADFVRATADIPVESIVAVRYNARNIPVTQPADVVASGLSVN